MGTFDGPSALVGESVGVTTVSLGERQESFDRLLI